MLGDPATTMGHTLHYNPFFGGCGCLAPCHYAHNGQIICKGIIKGVNDRYPHKKATRIAIQTLKESLGDILEVNLLVLFCNKSNLAYAFRFEATRACNRAYCNVFPHVVLH